MKATGKAEATIAGQTCCWHFWAKVQEHIINYMSEINMSTWTPDTYWFSRYVAVDIQLINLFDLTII